MSLLPTYSRRKREAEGKVEDVYVYDRVPQKVRVQVVQILRDGLGPYYKRGNYTRTASVYDYLYKQTCRELGVHCLPLGDAKKDQSFFSWLEEEQNIDHWLDGVEQALMCIDRYVRDNWNDIKYLAESAPDNVISELNARLREAAVGYEFSEGIIIRKDSEIIHKKVVIPTLRLLSRPQFSAADGEFREAHEAFRHDRLEDCIVNCGKALESVLKVIGTARGWPIKDNDTASRLIQAAVDAGFLAAYSKTALNHLRGLIESSTPTIRNKMGGHGAGAVPRSIPMHLASFQLHQTAAVILFLAEQDAHLGGP